MAREINAELLDTKIEKSTEESGESKSIGMMLRQQH